MLVAILSSSDCEVIVCLQVIHSIHFCFISELIFQADVL